MKTIEFNFNAAQISIIKIIIIAITTTLFNAIATDTFFFIGTLIGATLFTLTIEGLSALSKKFAKKAA